MNMAVFFQISLLLEQHLYPSRYIGIIVAIWILTSLSTMPLIIAPTLGFSGILMGLLAFCVGLFQHRKQFSRELLIWLGINIVIGFIPQISFWGHLCGALSGTFVFGIYRLFGGKLY